MGGVSPEESSSTALKMEAASFSETSVILPTNSASFTISPLETSARRFVKFAWQCILLVVSDVPLEGLRKITKPVGEDSAAAKIPTGYLPYTCPQR
jgi:hypothetical protein